MPQLEQDPVPKLRAADEGVPDKESGGRADRDHEPPGGGRPCATGQHRRDQCGEQEQPRVILRRRREPDAQSRGCAGRGPRPLRPPQHEEEREREEKGRRHIYRRIMAIDHVEWAHCKEAGAQERQPPALPPKRQVERQHRRRSQQGRDDASQEIQRPEAGRQPGSLGKDAKQHGRQPDEIDVQRAVVEEVRVPVALGEAERREQEKDLVRVIGEVVLVVRKPPFQTDHAQQEGDSENAQERPRQPPPPVLRDLSHHGPRRTTTLYPPKAPSAAAASRAANSPTRKLSGSYRNTTCPVF